jgi:hypothetical protein
MKINANHGVVIPVLILGEIWFCMSCTVSANINSELVLLLLLLLLLLLIMVVVAVVVISGASPFGS